MKTTINLLSISISLIIAAGCTITVPQNAIDVVQAALTNNPPVVAPPVVVVPPVTNTAPIAADTTGKTLCTPYGIDSAYMESNGGEETSIEPHTGLMLRIAVWSYDDAKGRWGWWLISSIGEGHIKRVGDTLVFTDYTANGVTYKCQGWCRGIEPQTTDSVPVCQTVAGNVTPYDGTRQYCLVKCWK